jgi:hypothetical protein
LGDYKGNGQILIIPFRGSGKINVTYGRLWPRKNRSAI